MIEFLGFKFALKKSKMNVGLLLPKYNYNETECVTNKGNWGNRT